jgi:tetratricopeptide (TPR) repeat protein/Mrp family chromosome partitioning ATPase
VIEADSPSVPGIIYTFYSYKGGVGRSMALVNVGVLLAILGKRVLLIDWDLEAPGLEMHFRQPGQLVGDPETVAGIVDLLEARIAGRVLPWQQCLLHAEFLGKSLDIISAGSRTADYRGRVQRLDWDALYGEHKVGNFINDLRDEWRAVYDFVLVDSRTGMTDIGDICTVLLPDAIVLLFVTNYQNVEGVKKVMARAVAARSRLPVNRVKLLGIPLPSRDEVYNEHDKSLAWKRIYASEFGNLYREWLPREVTPEDALNKLFIPYVTNWSFGECIPVLENARETQNPTTIGAAYMRMANLLANGLDWYSLEGRVAVEHLQGAQLEILRERERADKFALSANRSRRRSLAIAIAAVALAVVSIWAGLVLRRPQSTELIDGRQLFDAGKTEEARKIFQARASLLKDRLKSSPDDPLLLTDIDNTNTWLGDAQTRLGRSSEALTAYQVSRSALERALSKSPGDQQTLRSLAVTYNRIGGILQEQGKLEEALASFRSGKAIMVKLNDQDKSNNDWQRELSVTHSRIGGILQEQGKLEEALASFRSDKAIADKLAAQDPSNTGWQRDLARTEISIGRILRDQGKLEEALASFRSSKTIRDEFAARDPSDSGGQVDLAASHSWIGAILQDQGKLEEALASVRLRKGIMEKLSTRDPSNKSWQSELAASNYWVGRALQDQGKLEEAMASYRSSETIREELTAQDPSNKSWQRGLAVSRSWIGDILREQGHLKEALASCWSGKTIMEKLTTQDPSNAGWQADLAWSRNMIGRILQDQGKLEEALQEFAAAKALLTKLGAPNSNNAFWRRDLVELLRREAAAHLKGGNPMAALASVAQAEIEYHKTTIEKGAENFWEPEGARVLMQRGEIRRAIGGRGSGAASDLAEAGTLLARLLKSNPEHAQWKRDLERLTALQK